MTAFLTLNGITAPVLADKAPLAEEEVGTRRRALDGTLIVDRRTLKRAWEMTLVPDVAATQLAFRDLLDGKHEIWSFETGAYSSRGNPAAFTGTGARTIAQIVFAPQVHLRDPVLFVFFCVHPRKYFIRVYLREMHFF